MKRFITVRMWEETKDKLEVLGVYVDGDNICFKEMYDEDGYELKELLEELGWICEFEGTVSRFETSGVYFIK